jgi:protocatechuate 3,4-dioxygenase alpha subunit
MKNRSLTPPQTIGPFFEPALLRPDATRNVLVLSSTTGERIRIEGRVIDGRAEPVPEAIVEIWQADSYGQYNHPADDRSSSTNTEFLGFGRSGTDEDGCFWFETIRPGPVPSHLGEMQAPHISIIVFARGLLDHVATRLYFADEPSNSEDPVLMLVPPERRSTLIAQPASTDQGRTYQLDIVLQGAAETAFFRY